MQKMNYEVYQDNFNSVLGKLKNIVRGASKRYQTVYIGATKDWSERRKKYPDWKYGQVVLVTNFFEYAKLMEELLITYANSEGIENCNIDEHSKGLRPGSDKYFVYILANDFCALRK